VISEAQRTTTLSRRYAKSPGRAIGGLGLSVAAHFAVATSLGSLFAAGLLRLHEPPPVVQDVDVVPVSSSRWEQNLAAAPSAAPAVAPRTHRDAPREPPPSGQIVDVAAGNALKPAESKYLAEHDNRVDKETRAREQTAFYQKALPQKTSVEPTARDEHPKGDRGTGSEEQHKAERAVVAERVVPKSQLSTRNPVAPSDPPQAGSHDDGNRAGSDGKVGEPDAPEQPSQAGVKGEASGGAPNDFLDNVPIGDGTFLNTREYKYAGFFNRVKQRVGEQWRPDDAFRRKDPNGRAASHKRITVVDVVLDDGGRLADIRVSQSCGIDFLDEEAVAAFQRAAPFPNPPTGLLESDRHIRFRFGFHIDNDARGRLPLLPGRGR
jgi:TonB family protein